MEGEPRLPLQESGAEIIAKFTKQGSEVVNMDGFTFLVRKRKRTSTPLEKALPGAEAANLQPEPAPTDGAAVAASAFGGLQHGTEGAEPAEDAAEQLPPAVMPPTGSLEQPQQDVGQQDQGADPTAPMDVQEAQQAVEQQQQPEEQQQQPEEQQQQPAQPAREQDLKAIVGSLRGFIPAGCPTAVGVSWLLRETLRAAVPPGDEAGAAAAAAVLQAFQQGLDQQVATAKQLLQQGGPEHLQQFDSLPPMVRSMCESERHMASLRQQLEALEREEAAWQALEAKYRPGADCVGGEEAGGSAGGNGDEEEEAVIEQRVDVAALEDAQRRVEHQLSLQVDAISNMLDKAEFIMAKAQQQCSSLQADYHKENFQCYAHVNSPQVLIKILSQAVPTAGVDFVPSSQPTDS